MNSMAFKLSSLGLTTLPLLWTFGVHVNDIAWFFLVMSLTHLKLDLSRTAQGNHLTDSISKNYERWVLIFFLCSFAFFVAIEPWILARTGQQGSEFIVFSQIVDNVSNGRGLLSSSVEQGDRWLNFLSHHWSPIFYLPGWFSHFFDLPGYVSLLFFHFTSTTASIFIFFLIARHFKIERDLSLIVTVFLVSLPTFRHVTFHSVHDEVFALPYVALMFLSYLKRNSLALVVSTLFATLCKENLFLITSFILFGFLALESLADSNASEPQGRPWSMLRVMTSRRSKLTWTIISLIGFSCLGFLAYFFFQPIIFQKSFDHMNKVASLDTLFSPNFIIEKLFFIFNLFLPFLPFVWLGRRTERFYFLLLGVVPQLLLVAISNFPEMWKPLNYYGMVPSLILGVAAISVIASVKDRQLQRGVLMIAIFISFTQSGYKPARTLFNLWASDSSVSLLDELPLRVIPQDKRIIATPAASLYLFDHDFLWQLDKANKLQDLDFDFIVTKRSEEALISSHLRQVSAACADQSLKNAGDWLVLCRVR